MQPLALLEAYCGLGASHNNRFEGPGRAIRSVRAYLSWDRGYSVPGPRIVVRRDERKPLVPGRDRLHLCQEMLLPCFLRTIPVAGVNK